METAGSVPTVTQADRALLAPYRRIKILIS
jgi:hypothetical protein